MGQVSSKLRRGSNCYFHWCPACEQMHALPDSWNFVNKDLENPTFTPSFDQGGVLETVDQDGEWDGDFRRDEKGNPIPYKCHYILTNGVLNFCGDSTHKLAGQSVALPELPNSHKDIDA